MAGLMGVVKGGTTSKGKSKAKGTTKLQAKYENALNRIRKADIKAKEGAQAALGVAEIGGATYGSAVARGWLGADRFTIPGTSLDLALVAGGVGSAYNLMNVLRGKGNTHVANLSAGLLCSGLVSLGEAMGAKLADKASGLSGEFGGEEEGMPFAGHPVFTPGMQGPQGF